MNTTTGKPGPGDEQRPDALQSHDGGPIFWVAVVVGWGLILAGVRMGVHDPEVKPMLLAKWLIGGLVLHDAFWLTAVAGAGWVISRAWPRRPPILVWAAASTVVLAVVAFPLVRGYGRSPDNLSALPRNYAHGLVAYVALIWGVALVVLAVRTGWRHRRGRT